MTEFLFEDEYLVAFNKPAWWLTHPSDEARHIKENAMTYVRDQVGGHVYPINRLDLQSSGIVLFGKQPEVVRLLKKDWEQCDKKYWALARGQFTEPEGVYDFELGNDQGVKKPAHTSYKILQQFDDCAFAEVSIQTGRRHQIRRHFSRRMHALIGDRKYGKKKWNDPFVEKFGLSRLFLHAFYLGFPHPYSGESMAIHCALPEELQQIIEGLQNENN